MWGMLVPPGVPSAPPRSGFREKGMIFRRPPAEILWEHLGPGCAAGHVRGAERCQGEHSTQPALIQTCPFQPKTLVRGCLWAVAECHEEQPGCKLIRVSCPRQ